MFSVVFPGQGSQKNGMAKEFIDKFEIPYSILPDNIKFFNVLGNNDYNIKIQEPNGEFIKHLRKFKPDVVLNFDTSVRESKAV